MPAGQPQWPAEREKKWLVPHEGGKQFVPGNRGRWVEISTISPCQLSATIARRAESCEVGFASGPDWPLANLMSSRGLSLRKTHF